MPDRASPKILNGVCILWLGSRGLGVPVGDDREVHTACCTRRKKLRRLKRNTRKRTLTAPWCVPQSRDLPSELRRPDRKVRCSSGFDAPSVVEGHQTGRRGVMRIRPSPNPRLLTLGLPAAHTLFLSAIGLMTSNARNRSLSVRGEAQEHVPIARNHSRSDVCLEARGHRRLPPAAAFDFAHRPSPHARIPTAETLRPAQRGDSRGCEACLELEQVAWIILHEGAYYILGSPESSGYPNCVHLCRSTSENGP